MSAGFSIRAAATIDQTMTKERNSFVSLSSERDAYSGDTEIWKMAVARTWSTWNRQMLCVLERGILDDSCLCVCGNGEHPVAHLVHFSAGTMDHRVEWSRLVDVLPLGKQTIESVERPTTHHRIGGRDDRRIRWPPLTNIR